MEDRWPIGSASSDILLYLAHQLATRSFVSTLDHGNKNVNILDRRNSLL